MALNWQNKRTIDYTVPTLFAMLGGYVAFKKKGSWQLVLVVAIMSFIFLYFLTTQVTKRAYAAGPRDIPAGSGQDVSAFDPTALINGIHEDITCYLCIRNRGLYDQLNALTDGQLIKAWNYWKNTFYNEDQETLPQAIANESAFMDSNFGQQQATLAARFQKLNLS